MTSSLAAVEAATWVKSAHVIKSCMKTRKKRTWKYKILYTNLNLKDRLDIEFTVCYSDLLPEEALTSLRI